MYLTYSTSKRIRICVILTDVDDLTYDINNILDMKLLYVAITRALHHLDILYTNDKLSLYNKK